MIVIYGQRTYGAVDEQAGQYAVTKFAHIYYLPIIPTGSVWITGPDRGIPTPLNFKSIAAGYLRTWGLGLGIMFVVLGLAGSGLLVSLAGLVCAALSIATWRWRTRSTEEARLRGNLSALAFGTYCPPKLLAPPIREHYKIEMQRRQQITPTARPPEDVARFGTRDLGELVRAYGVLSLHDSPQAREQLEQLLTLKAPSAELTDGIYRDKNAAEELGGTANVHLPTDRAALLEAIEDAAAQRMINV